MTAIVVHKRTTLTQLRHSGENISQERLAKLQESHDCHHRTLQEVCEAIEHLGINMWIVEGAETKFVPHPNDQVICVGGDGTVLSASHSVGTGIPLMAINSDPIRSHGRFCGGSANQLPTLFEGKLRHSVNRMSITVNDSVISRRVLNDALFSHTVPAAMTRCEFRGRDMRGSGVWVSTAAGSTGAVSSADGPNLDLYDTMLALVFREPWHVKDRQFKFVNKCFTLKSLTDDATLYLDGPYSRTPVTYGSSIVFQSSPEPLTLVGIFND